MITGQVEQLERQQNLTDFKKKPEIKLALLQINICGQGLDISCADKIVFIELFWNPS